MVKVADSTSQTSEDNNANKNLSRSASSTVNVLNINFYEKIGIVSIIFEAVLGWDWVNMVDALFSIQRQQGIFSEHLEGYKNSPKF